MELWLILFFILTCGARKTRKPDKPNVILILADDLGWNEVSWLVDLEPQCDIGCQRYLEEISYHMWSRFSIFRHNERIKTPTLQVGHYCLFIFLVTNIASPESLQARTETGEVLRHTKMFSIKSSAHDWDVSFQVNYRLFKGERKYLEIFY